MSTGQYRSAAVTFLGFAFFSTSPRPTRAGMEDAQLLPMGDLELTPSPTLMASGLADDTGDISMDGGGVPGLDDLVFDGVTDGVPFPGSEPGMDDPDPDDGDAVGDITIEDPLPFANDGEASTVAGTKREASSDISGAPTPKRQRVFSTTAQGDPIGAKLSEAERRAVLHADPIARTVESNRVFCVECKKWVKLGDGVRFRIKHWAGHCALVHKRDRETASMLVSRGVQAAAEAAAAHAAALVAMREAGEEEARKRAAAAVAAANLPVPLEPSGTSTPRTGGGIGAGKAKVMPTRSVYETRATGRPLLDPRVPPRYNYEDEITEPYYFSDSDDAPEPSLPLRLRKPSNTWYTARRAFPPPNPTFLPSDVDPPRRLSARELRFEAMAHDSEGEDEDAYVPDREGQGPFLNPKLKVPVRRRRQILGRPGMEEWEWEEEEDEQGVYEPYPQREPADDRSRREREVDQPEQANGADDQEQELGRGSSAAVDESLVAPAGDDSMDVDGAEKGEEAREEDVEKEAAVEPVPNDAPADAPPTDAAAPTATIASNNAAADTPEADVGAATPSDERADSTQPTASNGKDKGKEKEKEEQWMDLDPPPTPPGMGLSLGLSLGDISFGGDNTNDGFGTPDVIARDVPLTLQPPRRITARELAMREPLRLLEPWDIPRLPMRLLRKPGFAPDPVRPLLASAPMPAPTNYATRPPVRPRLTADEQHQRDVRRAELQRDPDVRAISVDAVQCNGCGKWFKLSADLYTASRWYGPKGHKKKCLYLGGGGVDFAPSAPSAPVLRSAPVAVPAPAPPPVRVPPPAPPKLQKPAKQQAAPAAASSASTDERTDEQWRKDKRVRRVEGDRVQCADCGKWLFKPNFDGHVATRCRPTKGALAAAQAAAAAAAVTEKPKASTSTSSKPIEPVHVQPSGSRLPAPPRQVEIVNVTSTSTSSRAVVPIPTQRVEQPKTKTEDVATEVPPAESMAPPPVPAAKKVQKRVSQAALKAATSTAQLAAQRRVELKRDPMVREVTADSVQCDACGVWVKLGDALYAGHKWDGRMGHKARCPELAKKAKKDEPKKKDKPKQEDFYIPAELKDDKRIRQFDGDYVQCNHCGKWLVQENWTPHIESRCSRLRKSGKQKGGTASSSKSVEPIDVSDESSLSDVDDDFVPPVSPAVSTSGKGKERLSLRRLSTSKPSASTPLSSKKPESSSAKESTSSDPPPAKSPTVATKPPSVRLTVNPPPPPAAPPPVTEPAPLPQPEDNAAPAPTAAPAPAPAREPSLPPPPPPQQTTSKLSKSQSIPGLSSDPTPTSDYQLLRKRLLESPAVRQVEGERLQCNYCGKWLLIERWDGHIEGRCRHKNNAPGSATPGAEGSSASGSGQELAQMPFSKEVIAAANQAPGRTLTSEEKDAIAQKILKETIAGRVAELEADPDVKEIGEGTVLCGMCDQWVKLSNHMYAAHRWFGPNGHKAKCPSRSKSRAHRPAPPPAAPATPSASTSAPAQAQAPASPPKLKFVNTYGAKDEDAMDVDGLMSVEDLLRS
ncbi:hypothetical protein EXIGLDRAFT_832093 [Exidia glandulosa HHB12029]|uniref:Uncharacterized protein n=1 Tax=Exidia glandulosa HHB12029 TaxID=1314781 RepID=A0A165LYW4_EXIGL|nr:hypothetical protein EXIGLDRAFT_832093 [Exidia glandulosa HHB12029]